MFFFSWVEELVEREKKILLLVILSLKINIKYSVIFCKYLLGGSL